jgi:hypothetical protein
LLRSVMGKPGRFFESVTGHGSRLLSNSLFPASLTKGVC